MSFPFLLTCQVCVFATAASRPSPATTNPGQQQYREHEDPPQNHRRRVAKTLKGTHLRGHCSAYLGSFQQQRINSRLEADRGSFPLIGQILSLCPPPSRWGQQIQSLFLQDSTASPKMTLKPTVSSHYSFQFPLGYESAFRGHSPLFLFSFPK